MEKRGSGWLIGVFLVISLLVGGGSVAAKDGDYEVVSPLGKSTAKVVSPAPRLSSLEGKKIGLYCNNKKAAQPILTILETKLKERFPTSQCSWCQD